MFEVIITACLINAPGTCKDFHYPVGDVINTPMKCHMESVKAMVHNLPKGYRVDSYKCDRINKEFANI